MKKNFILLFSLLCIVAVNAQTVYPGFADGIVFFKIKPGETVMGHEPAGQQQFDLTHFSFVNALKEKYQINKLEKPFAKIKKQSPLQHTYMLTFNNITLVDELIKDLEKLPQIEYAEKDVLYSTTLTPNDPMYANQWFLPKIGAENAWNYFSTGSNIVIAVVDNAIDISHVDLIPNLWINSGEIPGNGLDDDNNGYIDDISGYDFADSDPNPIHPDPSVSHGTHVAGLASAATNNAIGIASIGYSCKIMSLKAFSNNHTGSFFPNSAVLAQGILYAVDNGASIINCSFGSPSTNSTQQNVVNYAVSQGVLVVASAGNDNVNQLRYPAAYNGVVSVAATAQNDTKASFSNYGTYVKISAPGVDMRSTLPANTYGNSQGTSQAAPVVAGLLGLMKSLNPNLTASQLTTCLYNTATNINSVNPAYIGLLGAGRINADSAMACVFSTLPVKLLYLQGRAQGMANVLEWGVAAEINFSHYIIERSGNGRDFDEIGKLAASPEGASIYFFTDRSPLRGVNFYRLKMVDIDGRYEYSYVIQVKDGEQQNQLKVSPNPVVRGSNANLLLTGTERGNIIVKVTTQTGQVVHSQTLNGTGGVFQASLSVNHLNDGVYFITCFNDKWERIGTSKLVIQ